MLIFSLTKLTSLEPFLGCILLPQLQSLVLLLPIDSPSPPHPPLAMCVSDSVFNLISIGLVSALYRAWCKAIDGNEKSSVSTFSLGIIPSSYSVHTVTQSPCYRERTHLEMPWTVSFTLQDFLYLLVINIIMALLRFFYLQRTRYALLLAIFYPALPQPHKGQYCYCWMWFRKKEFCQWLENSLWSFQSFIQYRNYPESRILFFSPSSKMNRSSQKLEGVSKHFASDSLRGLLFYLHHHHTRVKAQRIWSQRVYWTSSGRGHSSPGLGLLSSDFQLLLPNSVVVSHACR